MVTYTLKQYRKVLDNKLLALRRTRERTPLTVSTYMIANARRLAPRYTGETINGIRKRKLKNGKYQVESRVSPKGKYGFRQNLWANQSEPWVAPSMRWNRYQPTRYGTGPARYSASPRFWTMAFTQTRRQFQRLVQINTQKALRAGL